MDGIEPVDAALAWHRKGIIPIPVRPTSKVAAIRWARWQHRRPPRALIRRWFRNANVNLGLLCGPISGNLCVLDFDKRSAWLKWRRRHKNLARSYRVRTDRGVHLYLRAADLPRSSFSLGKLDVKTSGYVLGVPSVHPSGHLYRPIDTSAPILRIGDIAEALDGIGQVPRAKYKECGLAGAKRPLSNSQTSPPILGPGLLPNHTQGPRHRLYRGIIADIKERMTCLDLAGRYTTMRASDTAGLWYLGRCPDPAHDDRNPSFRVDAVRHQAHCLTSTCRLHEPRGMDVVEFYGRLHGLSARDAMAEPGQELGLVARRETAGTAGR